MKVYTVTAYRWGDREAHSYTLGVYSTKEKALTVAEFEHTNRGGKYECEVLGFNVDEPREDEYEVVLGLEY